MPDAVEFTVNPDVGPVRMHAVLVAAVRYAADRMGTGDLEIVQHAPETGGLRYTIRRRATCAGCGGSGRRGGG